MEIVLVAVAMVLLLAAIGLFLSVGPRKEKDEVRALELLQTEIGNLRQQVDTRLGQITEQMLNTSKVVGERLEGATKVIGDVQQGLGRLTEASKQILEVGKDISSLQNILQPPKLRGGLGETLLGNLLSQLLPSESFEMPHQFSTGQVDAVIQLANGLVPVDAKFPLENFMKVTESSEDTEKRLYRKEFVRDVRKHIDDISTKYILPDEGTLDFALMYIPAENIYYEMIIKNKDEESIADYALSRRVVPVSPNTFWAYLQAIALGLKGLRVEKYASEILASLTRLRGDLESFCNDFQLVGTHLSRATDRYGDALRSLDRFQHKLSSLEVPDRIEQLPEEVSGPQLPAKAGQGGD